MLCPISPLGYLGGISRLLLIFGDILSADLVDVLLTITTISLRLPATLRLIIIVVSIDTLG